MKILVSYGKKWGYLIGFDNGRAVIVNPRKAVGGSQIGKIEFVSVSEVCIVDESYICPEMMAVKGMDENGEVVTYYQPVDKVAKNFLRGEMSGVATKTVGSISSLY